MEHDNEYLQAGYLFYKMSTDIEAGRHFNKEADLAAIYKWLQNIYQNIMKYFDFGGAGMKALQQPKPAAAAPAVPSYSPEQEAAAKIGVEKMMRGGETPAMFLSADELAARKAQESARKVDWADPFGLKKSEMDILGSPADIKKEFAEMRATSAEKGGGLPLSPQRKRKIQQQWGQKGVATAAAAEKQRWVPQAAGLASSGLGAVSEFFAPELNRAREALTSFGSDLPPMIGLPSSRKFTSQEMKQLGSQAIEAKTHANRARTYASRRKPERYVLPTFSKAEQQAIETQTLADRARAYHSR